LSAADEKVLKAVQSFLDRQKLDYSAADEQYCTKVTVKNRGQTVPVSVYNSGKIVAGGTDSELKRLLEEMKKALLEGSTVPEQALPFEIDRFPDLIRERVPECDPVIVAFIDEAIRRMRADALLGRGACLVQQQRTSLAMGLSLYPPLRKGGMEDTGCPKRSPEHARGWIAAASIPEAPGAETLHAGICAGAVR
jgi:hypothetical protein